MKSELAWIAMLDQLEGTPSSPQLLADLAIKGIGKVVSFRTYEKGVLVNTKNFPRDLLG